MTGQKKLLFALGCAALGAAIGLAQRPEFYGGGADDREQTVFFTEGGYSFRNGVPMSRGGPRTRVDEETQRTAREVGSHATEAPAWTNAPGFEKDAFTFCRLRYVSSFSRHRDS